MTRGSLMMLLISSPGFSTSVAEPPALPPVRGRTALGAEENANADPAVISPKNSELHLERERT